MSCPPVEAAASTAPAHNYFVNVLAASRDLGNDPDEWERRGKLISTHLYEGGDEPQPQWYQIKDENDIEPGNPSYITTWANGGEGENWYNDAVARYNICNPNGLNYKQFDYTVARDDMENSDEKGLVYYVAVVHFADGSSAVSDTYNMYGF